MPRSSWGVNFDEVYDPERHHTVSNASCTTNCLAPLARVLHDTVGIRHGLMTTIHAYTADQRLLDAPHKDPRRAGILAFSEEPLVSADIVKSPFSAVFDALLTAVLDDTQVKVVAWYDNECGYASRLVELAGRVLAQVPSRVTALPRVPREIGKRPGARDANSGMEGTT